VEEEENPEHSTIAMQKGLFKKERAQGGGVKWKLTPRRIQRKAQGYSLNINKGVKKRREVGERAKISEL